MAIDRTMLVIILMAMANAVVIAIAVCLSVVMLAALRGAGTPWSC